MTWLSALGEQRAVVADRVVYAAAAIATAHSLLFHECDYDPNGFGNHSDQVGLLSQGHYYRVVMALKADLIGDDIGLGVCTSTANWSHRTPAIVGGGALADEFATVPMTLAKRHAPLDVLLGHIMPAPQPWVMTQAPRFWTGIVACMVTTVYRLLTRRCMCRSKSSVTARALAFRTATLMLKTLASSFKIGSFWSGSGYYETSVR